MMTEQADVSASEEEASENASGFFEAMGSSLLTGVTVIPLILPVPNEDGESIERILFAKLQIHADDDKLVYDAVVPLDVVATFSLNFLKACATALKNVRPIKSSELLYVELKDFQKLLVETDESISTLREIVTE